MMEKQFAKFFINLVNELIPDELEKERLFSCLRNYQSNQELKTLLSELSGLLREPSKLELYEYLRPLIMLSHQVEYSESCPPLPGVKLRLIKLRRRAGESLGFAVRGGFEHGIGVFVSEVLPGSQADRQGLKVGDEIVRVNGFTISEAIHEDVLDLIKSREDITLKVTHIGMLPQKEEPHDDVTWTSVEKSDSDRTGGKEIKIYLDSTGHASIGCGILSGPRTYPGIFIERVRPGSLADEVGLKAGDQIKEVNDVSFKHITHKEAVLTLKSSRQVTMVILKEAGVKLLEAKSSQAAQDEVSATTSTTAPTSGQREVQYDSSNFQLKGGSDTQTRLISSQLENGESIHGRMDINQETSNTPKVSTAADVHADGENNVPKGKYEASDIVPQYVYDKFTHQELDGRMLRSIKVKKPIHLGIEIEGGSGSPLDGRVLVATVFDEGVADTSGKLRVGDQLMQVNGQSMVNVSLEKAKEIFRSASVMDEIEVIYCESTLLNDEDSVTYF